MKRTTTGILVLGMAVTAPARHQEIPEAEKQAIIQTALDYMDGAHSGDPARIERSAHVEMNKVSIASLPTGRQGLNRAGYSRLLELVRANAVPLAPGERNIRVDVFTAKEGLACVLAQSARFYDYLMMAKIDGQWKYINILWRPNTAEKPNPPEADRDAIRQAALDYLDGFYSGDAERVRRGVHPELYKVRPHRLPQTGRTLLDKVGAELLAEAAGARMGLVDEDKRNIEINMLDINQDIAMVEAISRMYYDYLQLAKINGRWQIVNVLWVMNPAAPRPTP
ncbi:MAG: nuclear transport factor 2 family protein [Acidobacteriota bacterium]